MKTQTKRAIYDPFDTSLIIIGDDGSRKGYKGQIAMQMLFSLDKSTQIEMVNREHSERNQLLRKFYAIKKQIEFNETLQQELLAVFGKTRLSELTIDELKAACDVMQLTADKINGLDKSRKRVIAAICNWLMMTGQGEDVKKAKAIAARATGYDHFNKIPVERLNNIYNCFLKKSKDMKSVDDLTEQFFKNAQKLN